MEGYLVTGMEGIPAKAEYLGTHKGETFQQACENALKANDMDMSYYNPERNCWWGCRLFKTEREARKSFG